MWRSNALATPRLCRDATVRMNLISPCVASSSFKAPQADRDAAAVGTASALDAEKPRLLRGQLDHDPRNVRTTTMPSAEAGQRRSDSTDKLRCDAGHACVYSVRSARIGSRRIARRAGSHVATSATAATTTAAAANV